MYWCQKDLHVKRCKNLRNSTTSHRQRKRNSLSVLFFFLTEFSFFEKCFWGIWYKRIWICKSTPRIFDSFRTYSFNKCQWFKKLWCCSVCKTNGKLTNVSAIVGVLSFPSELQELRFWKRLIKIESTLLSRVRNNIDITKSTLIQRGNNVDWLM